MREEKNHYYMGDERVMAAVDKLFGNLRKYEIPMNMLHQYMPRQYEAVRGNLLALEPKTLALNGAAQFMMDYEYAAGQTKQKYCYRQSVCE